MGTQHLDVIVYGITGRTLGPGPFLLSRYLVLPLEPALNAIMQIARSIAKHRGIDFPQPWIFFLPLVVDILGHGVLVRRTNRFSEVTWRPKMPICDFPMTSL